LRQRGVAHLTRALALDEVPAFVEHLRVERDPAVVQSDRAALADHPDPAVREACARLGLAPAAAPVARREE